MRLQLSSFSSVSNASACDWTPGRHPGLVRLLDVVVRPGRGVQKHDTGHSLGMSDGAMVFISVVAAAFFVVGAVPLGYLADRYRRAPIIGACSLLFSAMVFLSGLVVRRRLNRLDLVAVLKTRE